MAKIENNGKAEILLTFTFLLAKTQETWGGIHQKKIMQNHLLIFCETGERSENANWCKNHHKVLLCKQPNSNH